MKAEGFYTAFGYVGFFSDGRKMLFSTEDEYIDALQEGVSY